MDRTPPPPDTTRHLPIVGDWFDHNQLSFNPEPTATVRCDPATRGVAVGSGTNDRKKPAVIPRTSAVVLLYLLSALALSLTGCSKSEGTTEPAPAASRPKAKKSVKAKAKPRAAEEAPAAADDIQSAPAEPVQKVVRPTLKVPVHDDRRLAEIGIHRYESRRLVLYTDIDPERAKPLPKLMDEVYVAWEDYFGPLPPDRERTDFQMIGYIMGDRELFRQAGLFGSDDQILLEGVFRDQLFWMKEQPTDFYRRHLMIHEGTHCFMSAFPNATNNFRWYMEGMAELFRSHQTDREGKTRFRVFPYDRDVFEGLGWLKLIDEDIRATGVRTIDDVVGQTAADFRKYNAYSWSWALCAFLDGHPKYSDRFRRLGTLVTGRHDAKFELRQAFQDDWRELSEEWLVFAGNICYGYDIQRTVLDLRPGKPLAGEGAKAKLDVAPDRGWQSSGILLEQGKTYQITATGRCVLASEPKPWESEAQGISIRYHGGLPLGMLVASLHTPQLRDQPPYTSMLDVLPVGRECLITPRVTGILYFRVNDFWNELADNTGSYQVTVKVLNDASPP